MPATNGIIEIDPAADEALAHLLLAVQRAAYAVEAALIGDDRIPPLHETAAGLRAAPLRWLGAYADGALLGAVAWTGQAALLDVDRLFVAPAAHRRGVGRTLVREVLRRAGDRPVRVATGRANRPARALYESLGFVSLGDVEPVPGLWVTRYERPGSAAATRPA